MRTTAVLLVALGCHNPPTAVPTAVRPVAHVADVAIRSCDDAAWHTAAASRQRAWVSSLAAPRAHPNAAIGRSPRYAEIPATVVEIDGEDVQIATVWPNLIVTRWLPVSALGRVAIREGTVSPAPGSPPDPAIRIRVGAKLPASDAAWLAVSPADGISFAGVVPASVRGLTWDAPAAVDHGRPWHHAGTIRVEPRSDAAIRATVTDAAAIEIRGERAGWFEITARTASSEVDGYIERPPPPPPPPRSRYGNYEFSDDVIEGELISGPNRWSAGTCLYDRPGGTVVGMILADQPGVSKPAVEGWFELKLSTLWGFVSYYTDAPPLPLDLPKPDGDHGWTFDEGSTFDSSR